jgi:hypothetical protein
MDFNCPQGQLSERSEEDIGRKTEKLRLVSYTGRSIFAFQSVKNAPEHIQISMQSVLNIKRLGIKIYH